ncbi:MAG: conjugative transfer protein MobI(A/C) [Pseudomonadota bacterium]|nr:conjugative transfer protein MobI(A/C) [Pseudomonadota bacterium]
MTLSSEEIDAILSDCREALGLAEAHHEERKGIDSKLVLKATQGILRRLDELLKRAYLLTYLEAKRYCDAYLEGKSSLGDFGESYGYLHSRVELNKGTIDAYFQERRPNEYGKMMNSRIKKGAKGYAERALIRYASGEYEAELAIMTEEHYQRLRKQAETIKVMQRKIRSIEIFPAGARD